MLMHIGLKIEIFGHRFTWMIQRRNAFKYRLTLDTKRISKTRGPFTFTYTVTQSQKKALRSIFTTTLSDCALQMCEKGAKDGRNDACSERIETRIIRINLYLKSTDIQR